ncbi:MFS transporter [Pseudomonas sp. TCU-HL1]|uniref:MFS transporter n=1 Tax=Pseudomonas sp. TCU-HL1 TaxID=1856685 RepID=UPI00083CB8F8|nr:MFS transporter [Pseudomonas sp. TCU-HL1]AOE85311.1 transporter [Pseudomonas sp. TCU-HL1]
MPDSRSWPAAIRALRHPNFRLYFAGQAVSTLGSWLQQVALAWLIYRLTGSAALLGVTTFASLLPQLLVGPLAGAWIDRHDKRRLLIGVQGLLGLQAITLAVLTVTGLIGPTLIVAMAALLGVLNAFDTPLRQSLLSQFVSGKEDLPNALALNAMLFNSSRFIGPPLAGLLLGFTSEAACFAVNALSYLGLAAGLLVIRMAPTPRAAGSTGDVFREGLAYVAGRPTIRLMMLSVLVVNLTASSYAVLLPVFAKDIFAGDARTLGWLWGAAGLGSLASTLFLANRHALTGLTGAIMACVLTCGAALLGFAASSHLALSLLAMAALGFGISTCNVGTNILLQSLAPERLRGRVVSFYTSTRFGFDAIGGLLVGLLAERLGAPWAMTCAGFLLLGYCAWLLPRQRQLSRDIASAQREDH